MLCSLLETFYKAEEHSHIISPKLCRSLRVKIQKVSWEKSPSYWFKLNIDGSSLGTPVWLAVDSFEITIVSGSKDLH